MCLISNPRLWLLLIPIREQMLCCVTESRVWSRDGKAGAASSSAKWTQVSKLFPFRSQILSYRGSLRKPSKCSRFAGFPWDAGALRKETGRRCFAGRLGKETISHLNPLRTPQARIVTSLERDAYQRNSGMDVVGVANVFLTLIALES